MSLIFIGAGGSGVSALVQLMVDLDIPHLVCIDSSESETMNLFKNIGVETYIGHGTYLPKKGDLVIYSAATATSPEVMEAFQHTFVDHLSPPPLLYAEFLGELSKYMYTFAISGTHGKSTTTGMAAIACIEHIPDTALAIVGAGVTQRQGKHCRYNHDQYEALRNIVLRIISRKATTLQIPLKKLLFIIEADEFNHHFLFLEPDISIITSLDHDHVDIYPTREAYLKAFDQFCINTKEHIITLSSIATQLSIEKYKLTIPTQKVFTFTHLVGGHNHSNAGLALAGCFIVAQHFGRGKQINLQDSIEYFQGLKRRVELLGTNTHGVPVFSDYGHHPDEIKSTLAAFTEKYPDSQITCFFEAHQARRLLTFRDEFVAAFEGIYCIVVPPYTAREDIATIQVYIKELPTSGSLPKQVSSFADIAKAFTTEIKGKSMTDRSLLQSTLDEINAGSILCFSAGVLDSKLRISLK